MFKATDGGYEAFRSFRPEGGDVWHEVPFAWVGEGTRSRGAIDCVVARSSADEAGAPSLSQLTVVEFKTGQPRPEHLEQVIRYKEAVASLFPRVPIAAALVYSDSVMDV